MLGTLLPDAQLDVRLAERGLLVFELRLEPLQLRTRARPATLSQA